MAWKKEYAENRRNKGKENPEYREKRRIQGKTRSEEENKIYMKEYYQNNREKFKRTKEQQESVNLSRRTKYANDEEYRQKILGKTKQWQEQNPEKRKIQRIRKFGINLEEYKTLFESQNKKCAICGYEDLSVKNFFPVVDHDHKSGAVRGLLCMQCNMGIGKFKDNPDLLRSAARYLEERNSG